MKKTIDELKNYCKGCPYEAPDGGCSGNYQPGYTSIIAGNYLPAPELHCFVRSGACRFLTNKGGSYE